MCIRCVQSGIYLIIILYFTCPDEEPTSSEFGGSSPIVTIEYDDKNCLLLQVEIQYNRREARKDCVLSADELKQKLFYELEKKGIFVENKVHDRGSTLLARDRRRKIGVEKENKAVSWQESKVP